MANLFNDSYTYYQAWNELKNKYGVSALIVQAHIHHLQMVQSFRNGDFKSLAELASLVRDAVSSVAGEPTSTNLRTQQSQTSSQQNYPLICNMTGDDMHTVLPQESLL